MREERYGRRQAGVDDSAVGGEGGKEAGGGETAGEGCGGKGCRECLRADFMTRCYRS